MSDTLSAVVTRKDSVGRSAYLYLGLRCDAPLTRGRRLALAGREGVMIGRARGDELEIVRGDVLELRIPDPRLSSRHARLTRVGRSWVIEDLDSKNGVFVDGKPVTRLALEDDAVIDVGQTVLVFGLDDEVADDGELVEVAPGLATLLPSLAADHARLIRVARSGIAVCLQGETGTGKELVARAIHRASGRAGNLAIVNCGGLAPNLVEAELFGHTRGAFSGADRERVGMIRSADGGTLFLDEVAELPLAAQATLLRVLQEHEVTPVGADRGIAVDLRIVSATHRDLEARVAAGEFRDDLLARLAGVTVELVPLRERRADLSSIIAALLARHGAPATVRFSLATARALYLDPWRRNVRELEHALMAALAVRTGDELELPFEVEPAASPVTSVLSDEDRALAATLTAALAEHGGNLAAVARSLGKDRTQVRRWMRRLGLTR